MSAEAYYEDLKDPRWKQKRLSILDRDEFTCCVCSRHSQPTESDPACDNLDPQLALNVHHGYYERGLRPWEYPDDTLWTLCRECHSGQHGLLLDIARVIGQISPRRKWDLYSAVKRIRDA